MAVRLNTYRPLCRNKVGENAARTYDLPPFVDGSCRREPDFQNPFPSITCLCRTDRFAPHLRAGDEIAYLTKKGSYLRERVSHWRYVGLLRVLRCFPTHEEAAEWYRQQGLPIPSNCMIRGSSPEAYERTDRFEVDLRRWEAGYRLRARQHPAFVVTEALYLNLHNPPVLFAEDLTRVFGRIPGTQTPPVIQPEQLRLLREFEPEKTSE